MYLFYGFEFGLHMIVALYIGLRNMDVAYSIIIHMYYAISVRVHDISHYGSFHSATSNSSWCVISWL